MHGMVAWHCCLRVALAACLLLAPGCIALIGPDCRSWCPPSRGSSWRTGINVTGLPYGFVEDGNVMASRSLCCAQAFCVACQLGKGLPCLQDSALMSCCPGRPCLFPTRAATAESVVQLLSLAVATAKSVARCLALVDLVHYLGALRAS